MNIIHRVIASVLLGALLTGCLASTHAPLQELDVIPGPGDLEQALAPVLASLEEKGMVGTRFHVDRVFGGTRYLVLSYQTDRGITEAYFLALQAQAGQWQVLAHTTVELNPANGDAARVATGISPVSHQHYTFWAGCVLDRQIHSVEVILAGNLALPAYQSGRFFFLYVPELASPTRRYDLLDRHGAVVRNIPAR